MKRKPLPRRKQSVSNPRLAVLRKRVASAPTQPGIYRWLDDDGTVLYVGKAKNLRNRLRSYVSKENAAGPWKQSFREQIADFDVTVTNTEVEALIFETNLIKELKPKYNVLMKDDKNYIYARVTVQEPFPRIESVRKIAQDGAKYFGPMQSGGELWTMLTMLRSVFPFRTCGMEIIPSIPQPLPPQEEGESGQQTSPSSGGGGVRGGGNIPLEVECKYKDRPTPCLDFHIQKCSAPCTGTRTVEQYFRESIEGVIRFLKGDYESVRPLFEERMKQAALNHKFELAAQFRDYLSSLDHLAGKQIITDTSGEDSDIIAVAVLSNRADVIVMHRRNGRLIGDNSYSLAGQAEDAVEVLEQFLPQYYEEGAEIPDSVIISETIADRDVFEDWLSQRKGRRVRVILPERGRKSHLLQLAEKNVREKAHQREIKWESEKRNTESALADLQRLLTLPSPPARIEGYDISHLGGTETVGSMVVMIGGKARSDQYRSFTLRSIRSGEVDDYKSLKEVLKRRLRHLVEAVKEEERMWTGRGIKVRKGKKSDQKALEDFLLGHEDEVDTSDPDPKNFVIAERKKKILGCGRIRSLEKTAELSTVIVHESLRGERLGQFIIRTLLKGVKKGKVYLETYAELEEYYAMLGFRAVRTAPKPILEKAERAQKFFRDKTILCMMFDTVGNKTDVSLASRPDLLVIDGGKGQLSAVSEVLRELKLKIPVIGLAKREEEVFVPRTKIPVFFPKDSQAKFLLMRLRDEAHRFANRHREAKGKKTLQSSLLDEIPSIGNETRKKLLQKFGSLTAIREAKDEELADILSVTQLKELRRRLG